MSAAARRRSSPSASRLGRSGAKSSAAATVTEATPSSARPSGNHANGPRRARRRCSVPEARRRGPGRRRPGPPGPVPARRRARPRRRARRHRRGRPRRGERAREPATLWRTAKADRARQSTAASAQLMTASSTSSPLSRFRTPRTPSSDECDGQGPAAATRELPCGAEEGKPGGEGQRMGQGDLVDGGDGQESAQPRRDRGGQRGGDVDDARPGRSRRPASRGTRWFAGVGGSPRAGASRAATWPCRAWPGAGRASPSPPATRRPRAARRAGRRSSRPREHARPASSAASPTWHSCSRRPSTNSRGPSAWRSTRATRAIALVGMGPSCSPRRWLGFASVLGSC